MTTLTDIANRLYENLVETDNGCWPFIGGRSGDGYGVLYIGEGKQRGAHVVSYEIEHGPVPPGMFVCHSCDNPPCCNPDHLFLGSLQDNKNDEVSKRRHVFGSRVGNSKLTSEDVLQIRECLTTGLSERKIGDKFGVTGQLVHRIKTREAWGWL